MGIADFARQHPTSFRRKCTSGETTFITLKSEDKGLAAVRTNGQLLYKLVYDSPESLMMVGPDNQTVLKSSAGVSSKGYRIKDSHGIQLGSVEKGQLIIEGAAYTWRKKASPFGGDTLFVLKESSQGASGATLAEVSLSSKTQGKADLTAYPAAVNIPLGLIVFQALEFYHRWLALPALKRVAFSSLWM